MASSAAIQPRDPRTNRFMPMDEAARADVDAIKRAWLEALRSEGTVRKAAELLGMNTWPMYRWRELDPEFDAAWDAAMVDVKDAHVGHLVRLGRGEGMPAVVANLARLKNLDPAGWSEKHMIVHLGDNPAQAALVELTNRLRARGTVIEGSALPAPATPDPLP